MKDKFRIYAGVFFIVLAIFLLGMFGFWGGEDKLLLQIFASGMFGMVFLLFGINAIKDAFAGNFSILIENCVSGKAWFKRIRLIREEGLIIAYYYKNNKNGKLLTIDYAGDDVDCRINDETDFFTVFKQGDKIVIQHYEPVGKKKKKKRNIKK